MGNPYYFPGTSKTWAPTGGDYGLTLTSLGNGSAWQGAKGTFYDGVNDYTKYPAWLDCLFQSAPNVTVASDGLGIELYMAGSNSGTAATDNPSQISGSNSAISLVIRLQLSSSFVGVLPFLIGLTTSAQVVRLRVPGKHQWFSPAVFNSSGQALSSTAARHLLTVTPFYLQLP